MLKHKKNFELPIFFDKIYRVVLKNDIMTCIYVKKWYIPEFVKHVYPVWL